jgi:hypothetical protein
MGDGRKLDGRRTKRIHQLLPVFTLEGDDFTASTADIRVDVERLPEVINGARTRHGTNVEEDANVGLKDRAKGIEEPAVGVDLLLVFLLQAKDDLHGNNAFLRAFDLVRRGNRDCKGHKTDGETSAGDTHSEWYTRIYAPLQASR